MASAFYRASMTLSQADYPMQMMFFNGIKAAELLIGDLRTGGIT